LGLAHRLSFNNEVPFNIQSNSKLFFCIPFFRPIIR
jgi:hypothetical protein